MQPAQAEGGGSSSSSLKKWGPIAAIVAVVAIVAGVLVVTSGGDDDDASDATTVSAPARHGGPTTRPRPTPNRPTPSRPTPKPPTAPSPRAPHRSAAARSRSRCRSARPRSRASTSRGATTATRRPDASPCATSSPPSATPRSRVTTAARPTQGVTADSIKVVYYLGPDDDPIINYITAAIANDDTNADSEATLSTMRDYYEQFYELYGRTVDLQFFKGSGIASDEVAARADAVRIAEEIKPFAVLGGPRADRSVRRRAVVPWRAVHQLQPEPAGRLVRRPRSVQLRHHRFGTTDERARHGVHQQADSPARTPSSPATSFTTTPRTFGLVYIESSAESAAIADEFVAQLSEQGIEIAERLPYALDPATIQAAAAQIISKLKASGVTTMIFSGDPVAPGDFTREATAQEYFPEWLLADVGAGRHDGVLPHVRPGTVAARLRRVAAERPHTARGQRLLLAVPVVQRRRKHRRTTRSVSSCRRSPCSTRTRAVGRAEPERADASETRSSRLRRNRRSAAVPDVGRPRLLDRTPTTTASTMRR